MVLDRYFFIKDTRAYTLTLEKDLLDDWVIRRTWGPRQSPYSQKRIEVFEDKEKAKLRLDALVRHRIKVRGYSKFQPLIPSQI